MSTSRPSIVCDGDTGSQVIADPQDSPFPGSSLIQPGWAAYVGIRNRGPRSNNEDIKTDIKGVRHAGEAVSRPSHSEPGLGLGLSRTPSVECINARQSLTLQTAELQFRPIRCQLQGGLECG